MTGVMKKLLEKWIGDNHDPERVRGGLIHRIFGDRIFSPKLWKMDRHGVAAGVACGIFWAMMPIPFQMIPSGFSAVLLRLNIPAAIASVWVTNPITWPVILYWQYRLGAAMTGGGVDWSGGGLPEAGMEVLVPLFLGCLISGVILSPISYALILLFWREHSK